MPQKPECPEHFDAEAYLDFMAPIVGLSIDEVSREEVIKLLQTAHSMASIVYSVPLDDTAIDLAPVFVPGRKT